MRQALTPERELLNADLGPIDKILVILAPPRSFSWRFCAALGQHPQMYGLPEMHLFTAQTVGEWWNMCGAATFNMSDGTLRALAEVLFGGQTEETIQSASGWLRRRTHLTTAMIFEVLAEKLHPRILVDQSPSIVYSIGAMQLAYRMFPEARFLHLVRHPRSHCNSVNEAIQALRTSGPIPEGHWLLELAKYTQLLPSEFGNRDSLDLNPQRGWYALNTNICNFLESVPKNRQIRIRAEEFLTAADKTLCRIAHWMSLSTDAEAIAEMMHPERSRYITPGPPNARFGNDTLYLNTASLSKSTYKSGPLTKGRKVGTKRGSGGALLPEVVDLARRLGYRSNLE
jgi:hypothetical protein